MLQFLMLLSILATTNLWGQHWQSWTAPNPSDLKFENAGTPTPDLRYGFFKSAASENYLVMGEKYWMTQSMAAPIAARVYDHFSVLVPPTHSVVGLSKTEVAKINPQFGDDKAVEYPKTTGKEPFRFIVTADIPGLADPREMNEEEKKYENNPALRRLWPVMAYLQDWNNIQNANGIEMDSTVKAGKDPQLVLNDFMGTLGVNLNGDLKNSALCPEYHPTNHLFKFIGCFGRNQSFDKILTGFKEHIPVGSPFKEEPAYTKEDLQFLIEKFTTLSEQVPAIVKSTNTGKSNLDIEISDTLKERAKAAIHYFQQKLDALAPDGPAAPTGDGKPRLLPRGGDRTGECKETKKSGSSVNKLIELYTKIYGTRSKTDSPLKKARFKQYRSAKQMSEKNIEEDKKYKCKNLTSGVTVDLKNGETWGRSSQLDPKVLGSLSEPAKKSTDFKKMGRVQFSIYTDDTGKMFLSDHSKNGTWITPSPPAKRVRIKNNSIPLEEVKEFEFAGEKYSCEQTP